MREPRRALMARVVRDIGLCVDCSIPVYGLQTCVRPRSYRKAAVGPKGGQDPTDAACGVPRFPGPMVNGGACSALDLAGVEFAEEAERAAARVCAHVLRSSAGRRLAPSLVQLRAIED